ncbi:MAG: bifunctional phosphoribosyl-AMP cyclohydrolase/phosphoribosyl-ATP diphosphatase HisIE [Thermoplasmatota archaeon]
MKHSVTLEGLAELSFDEQGLIPVVAQDEVTGAVLMLAWANQESLRVSLETGQMTYWSRSRQALWAKGETSGNTQRLVSLAADCDADALLATVQQTGPACHENTGTCWSDQEDVPLASWIGALDRLCTERKENPQGRYTDQLLADSAFAASKIEEEAAEVGAVLRGEDNDDSLEHEAADLLYHLVAGLHAAGCDVSRVLRELQRR